MATEYQELLDVMRAIEKSTAFIARRCAALRGVPTNVRPPAPHTIHVPADAPTALNWRPLFGTEHAVHIASARDGQYVVSRLDLSSGNVLWFADREPRGEQQWTGVLTVEQADAKAACQHHADTGRWPDAPTAEAQIPTPNDALPAPDVLTRVRERVEAMKAKAFAVPYRVAIMDVLRTIDEEVARG